MSDTPSDSHEAAESSEPAQSPEEGPIEEIAQILEGSDPPARNDNARTPRWSRIHRETIVATLLPIVLFIAGLISIRNVDAHDSGALGLVQAMPVSYFAIIGLLGISFVLCVRRNVASVALVTHVATFITLLHGLAAIIERNPRFSTVYTHVGFVDYLLHHNSAGSHLDARMSWPGFFAGGAILDNVSGSTTFTFLLWAPLIINLLYAPMVWTVARTASNDKRVAWFATWIFFGTSWVGQDYFSPQALNFLFFLTFVAVLLRYFRTDHAPYPRFIGFFAHIIRRIVGFVLRVRELEPGGSTLLPADARSRGFLLFALVIIYGAMVVSHQLTPFFLLIDLGILAILSRTKLRSLPLLLIITVFAWINYGAIGFWSGHINQIFGGVGNVSKTAQENVAAHTEGVKSNHIYVIYARLALSGVVWICGIFGIIRRLRAGKTDISLLVCFFGPFLILGGQSYGGEAILRVFLFSLPFAATFIAMILIPKENRLTIFKTTVACLAVVAMIPAFVLTRYGNERFEYISKDEYIAVQQLYRIAPAGSTIGAFDTNSALQIETKNLYDFRPVLSGGNFTDANYDFDQLSKRSSNDSFLLLTRAQIEDVSLTKGAPRSWGDQVSAALIASGKFKLVYQNPDAKIFQVLKQETGQVLKQDTGQGAKP